MEDTPTDKPQFHSVVFFDFANVLFAWNGQGWQARDIYPQLYEYSKKHRLGVLCNLPAGHDVAAFRLLLRTYGLEAWFDPALIIPASFLPTPLPDHRAFAAAAAIAETKTADLIYVTATAAHAIAAQQAGWRAELIGEPSSFQSLTEDLLLTADKLLAGEVDEDTGPTFILRGRVVTLDEGGRVLDRGRLIISHGKIVAVLAANEPVPADYAQVPEIDTAATLYPGLIDLHNHLPYNIIPLWQVPRRFDNRAQWQRHPDYHPKVSDPVVALANIESTAKAIARYVEAKAILGGVTTGQGMRMKVQSAAKHFVGALRNVENTDDHRLPEAATMVPDLQVRWSN